MQSSVAAGAPTMFDLLTPPAELDELLRPLAPHLANVREWIRQAQRSSVTTADAVGRHLGDREGKSLRPALALLAAQVTGTIGTPVLLAAAGIEVLQAATLLHDDVIDGAERRRGAPSINTLWGDHTAVLMGDVLFSESLSLFVAAGSLEVMGATAKATRDLIEGELLGKQLRQEPTFDESDYFELIRRKTAALMGLACDVGARLAGGDDEHVANLRYVGEQAGMAFQIIDDLLDVVGDDDTMGKPTGQDLREGTVTLPLIRALAAASPSQAEAVREQVRRGVATDEEWHSIRDFIHANDGAVSAWDDAQRLAADASQALTAANGTGSHNSLKQLIGFMTRRQG